MSLFSDIPKIQVTLVIWDSQNSSMLDAEGYTEAEINAILMNHGHEVLPLTDDDARGPGGITLGVTSSGKKVGVIWVAECGNPLFVYPLEIFELA